MDDHSKDILTEKLSSMKRPTLSDAAATAIMKRVHKKAHHRRAVHTVLWSVGIVMAAMGVTLLLNAIFELSGIDTSTIYNGFGKTLSRFAGIFSTTAGRASIVVAGVLFIYILLGEAASARLDNKKARD